MPGNNEATDCSAVAIVEGGECPCVEIHGQRKKMLQEERMWVRLGKEDMPCGSMCGLLALPHF